MSEDEFWTALEFRICLALSRMDDKVLRHMWCDGIRGDIVEPQVGQAYMSGTIWIGRDGQTEMQFSMTLPQHAHRKDALVWQDLLPSDGLTGWLSVDPQRKHVEIDLAKAEPLET